MSFSAPCPFHLQILPPPLPLKRLPVVIKLLSHCDICHSAITTKRKGIDVHSHVGISFVTRKQIGQRSNVCPQFVLITSYSEMLTYHVLKIFNIFCYFMFMRLWNPDWRLHLLFMSLLYLQAFIKNSSVYPVLPLAFCFYVSHVIVFMLLTVPLKYFQCSTSL